MRQYGKRIGQSSFFTNTKFLFIMETKNTNQDVLTKVAKATEKIVAAENNKAMKNDVKEFYNTYSMVLGALWSEFKRTDTNGARFINEAIAGVAGGEGLRPYEYVIAHFSRFVASDNAQPVTRKALKDADGRIVGYEYKRKALTASAARVILRDACLNLIESARIGTKFQQGIIDTSALVDKFSA